jgi:hypothetical protein
MSRIPMTSGFALIPEGTYVFRIYQVDQDEDFGKVIIKLINAKGMTHQERFSLKNNNDDWNEKALNAFSYFVKTAMNDFELEDVVPSELVNHYIKAEVVHSEPLPSKNDPTKTVVFANLGKKEPAEGFDTTPVKRALELGQEQTQSVDELLNN